jgi:hypothetical protein
MMTQRPSETTARAYSGPMHGATWAAGETAPDALTLIGPPTEGQAYRLVREPCSGRPARDQQGNYVYVPQPPRSGGTSHDPAPHIRVVYLTGSVTGTDSTQGKK